MLLLLGISWVARPATFMPEAPQPFKILGFAHFVLCLIIVAKSDNHTKQRCTPHCGECLRSTDHGGYKDARSSSGGAKECQ